MIVATAATSTTDPSRRVADPRVAVLVEVEAVEADPLGRRGEVGDEVLRPVGGGGIDDPQELAERVRRAGSLTRASCSHAGHSARPAAYTAA